MLGRMAGDTPTAGLAHTSAQAIKLKPLGLAVGAFVLLAALWYTAQVVVLDHSAAAAVMASVAHATEPLRPDASLHLTVHGAGVDLQSAQLFRVEQADDGSRGTEQVVPVRLQPTADEGMWQIVASDGATLLRTDGAYRLAVRIAAPRPALPMPRSDTFEEQYRFNTIASPRATLPGSVVQSRWAEPVSFTWSEPMQAVSVTVQPLAPLRTWIDSADPSKTWVQLSDESGAGLIDGQTYEVRVADAQARDGIALQKPVSFKLAVPQRPTFVDPPSAPITLRYGESFTLRSSADLTNIQATTSDDAPARLTIGRNDIRLDVPNYQQGAEFDLTVLSATSDQGAPLAQPVRVHVRTPAALEPPTVMPVDGSLGIQPSTHPSITFAQPLADPTAATAALAIDPPVAGHWQWTSPTRAEFVPDLRLPITTDITLSVRGGPDGPRTASGGFLDGDTSSTFRTTDFKRMEVSLSKQTMTLYESDHAVRTIYVATGVAAAPTPTGTFYVQYKSPQMRFRGVNPDGSRYDIADVNWVMPFWGDYTIHGAYWRPRFGAPGSNGCISMSDADARSLYDWADVGTPIVIRG